MELKTCAKCLTPKPHSEFYRCTASKDNRQPVCKACDQARNAGRHRSTPEATRAWRAANPDHEQRRTERDPDRHKRRYWADPESKREKTRRWSKLNPDKTAANAAKRRAVKLRATPPWLTEAQHAEIAGQFHFAAIMTTITGQPYEVDHIAPLQGRKVCGMHVPWNLHTMTEGANRRKHNKHDEHFDIGVHSLPQLIHEAALLAG